MLEDACMCTLYMQYNAVIIHQVVIPQTQG